MKAREIGSMGKGHKNDKKRHHFVPKAYLKAFCNESGRVWVYRKDNPQQPRPESPESTQFRNYYYSQPTPAGGRDNNSLEDFFSTIESDWPATVAKLGANEDVNGRLTNLFEFMSLQRARVPAARDFAEGIDAEFIKGQLALMHAGGKLPAPPPGYEDLPNQLEVAIDPHRSIYAMVDMFRSMGSLYDLIGLSIVHNKTSRPFLTSDNPVIWFDPSIAFDRQRPYAVNLARGPVALIFPISPLLAIVGDTRFAKEYARKGLLRNEIEDEAQIEAMNEQICRFAYNSVLASAQGQEDLILKHAEHSPVLEANEICGRHGLIKAYWHVFGKRRVKSKW